MVLSPCNPPKKIRKINRKIPYFCKKTLTLLNVSGIKLNKIHEPSNGGIGTKLNKANMMFIFTTKEKINKNPGDKANSDCGMNRNSKPKNKANDKLDKGPAIATFRLPHF